MGPVCLLSQTGFKSQSAVNRRDRKWGAGQFFVPPCTAQISNSAPSSVSEWLTSLYVERGLMWVGSAHTWSPNSRRVNTADDLFSDFTAFHAIIGYLHAWSRFCAIAVFWSAASVSISLQRRHLPHWNVLYSGEHFKRHFWNSCTTCYPFPSVDSSSILHFVLKVVLLLTHSHHY